MSVVPIGGEFTLRRAARR